MTTKEMIQTKNVPQAIGPYSQGIKAGHFIFLSGQIPLDPLSGQLLAGDITEQTERVLKNIKAVLESQKLSMEHVLKTTVFMTDLSEFQKMNEVYSRYFTGIYPARSTIQVAALPKGARVEIEVVAHAP